MRFLNNKPRSSLYRAFAMFLLAVIIVPPLTLSVAPQQAQAQGAAVGGALGGAASCLISEIVGGFVGAGTAAVEAALSVPVSNWTISGATVAAATSAWADRVKECVLDGLVWALAEIVIQQMMRDVIGWAQGGFEGTPAFMQDTGRWFRSTGEDFLVRALRDSSPIFEAICEPFRAQIRFNLILGTQRYDGQNDLCSLDEFLDGSSFEVFVEQGNFNAGGFKGFLGIQKPENNPVGTYMSVQEEIGKRLYDNVIAPNSNMLAYGNGYLSTKCDLNNDSSDGNEGVCTPGKFIADQISEHASAPLQKIIQADEFAEMINALIAAFVSQLLNDDGGLLGSSRSARESGGYWDAARDGGRSTEEWCRTYPQEPLCDGVVPVPAPSPVPEPGLTPAEVEANEVWRNDLSVAINALMMNLYGRGQAVQDAYMPRVLAIQSDLFRVNVTTLTASAELADIEERIRVILVELAIFTIELPGAPVGPSPLPPPPNPPPIPGDPTNPGPGLPPPPSLPPGYEIP